MKLSAGCLITFLHIFNHCIESQVVATSEVRRCKSDTLAVYRVTFEGNWDQDTFPKQFPEYRPPAQFSKTFGRVHDSLYSMFTVGANVSSDIKSFLETGRTDFLEKASKYQDSSIFHSFVVPALHSGKDQEDVTIFASSEYSRVSMLSKLIPSPDWFVGLQSFELCDGAWADDLTMEAKLYDAGINDGLTFTSPIFPSNPQEPVSDISKSSQNHSAASFYYPEVQELPPIGMFRFQKIDEFNRGQCVRTENQSVQKQPEARMNIRSMKRRLVSDVTTTTRYITDCEVSDWSEWSPCSQSCGLGEQSRSRFVVTSPSLSGRPCPVLREKRWCGSGRNCLRTESYFKW